jgi:acyl CoA:acetate/3-ketoacid CoA transferase alpha subunit
LVRDGSVVGFGGKTLHRAPVAFSRELIRAGVRELTVIGVANSIEVDMLCGGGAADEVHFGYVGFESFGLAPYFRREVEEGRVIALEGTCYTVSGMLRGAKQNVPFMPIAGLSGSDLPDVRDDFTQVTCPFTGTEVYAVRTVKPDVAVIHANEADATGNARFYGADLTENLLAKAADRVIVTTETIVDEDEFEESPADTNIPGVLVDTVVEVPFGAHPCSCPGAYDYDKNHLEEYLDYARDDAFSAYKESFIGMDESLYASNFTGEIREALAWERVETEVPT